MTVATASETHMMTDHILALGKQITFAIEKHDLDDSPTWSPPHVDAPPFPISGAIRVTSAGVADNTISLLTGHKSPELRRYQHLQEDLKRGTVDLIAKTLEEAQRSSKDRNGASSAHPLHTGSKTGKRGVTRTLSD